MNPKCETAPSRGFEFIQVSEFDRELENAKPYFGDDFPGDEGLTCQKCGAAVNLGWAHITWHEAASRD